MPNLPAVGTREVSEMRAGLACGGRRKRVGLLLRTPFAARGMIAVLLPRMRPGTEVLKAARGKAVKRAQTQTQTQTRREPEEP